MDSSRRWLFRIVAPEIIAKGFAHVDVSQLAKTGGLNPRQVQERFPDKNALIFALIDEINAAHRDLFDRGLSEMGDPQERLVHFFVSSFDFIDQHPGLAQIIAIALLGSEPELKERVYEDYESLFAQILDDLLAAGIIPDQSSLLVADLSEVLISVIFLGGSPRLQMEYMSFVNPRSVAQSVLKALRERYQARRHESLLR
jgi:AcrR family transcriptional regulator